MRLHSFDGLAFHDVAERLGLKDKNQARWIFQRALMKVGDLLSGEKD